MFVLRDATSERYITTRHPSLTVPTMPRFVDVNEADRFKTRVDAGLAMLRLPLTILAVAVEIPTLSEEVQMSPVNHPHNEHWRNVAKPAPVSVDSLYEWLSSWPIEDSVVPTARVDLIAMLDEIKKLRVEADESNAALSDSLDHWERLIECANNICAHCKEPHHREEMSAHVAACPSNPLVAQIAELRAHLADSDAERDATRNAILHMAVALNVDAPKGESCSEGWVLFARAVLVKVRENAGTTSPAKESAK